MGDSAPGAFHVPEHLKKPKPSILGKKTSKTKNTKKLKKRLGDDPAHPCIPYPIVRLSNGLVQVEFVLKNVEMFT